MKIILASSSPRRKQILSDAGFEFEVLKFEVDESFDAKLPVNQVPLYLAKKKMVAAKKLIREPAVVITADTVVILENKIIGKPRDEQDAFTILQSLSGKMHKVISGVCISGDQQIPGLQAMSNIAFTATTNVYFETLSDDEIKYYLDAHKPFDKAGAYAIQEWIGLNKISRIEGDYYNVVGLPMSNVYKILKSLQ